MAAGTEAESFVVSGRAQQATLRLARQVGTPNPNPNPSPNPNPNPNQAYQLHVEPADM